LKPVGDEIGPLRWVVERNYFEPRTEPFDVLECGHELVRSKNRHGGKDPVQRRCPKCKIDQGKAPR
jgi:ssDNA-binding Zn-finger/Zn-ribbon topoisomerase 1